MAEYFRAYKQYFWQWEDDGDVIAIPEGKTITYTKYVEEVIQALSNQGLPAFGALLMTIAATNKAGKEDVDIIYTICKDKIEFETDQKIINAIKFLKLLTDLPQEYKEGNRRLALLRLIFDKAHNKLSVKKSQDCIRIITNKSYLGHYFPKVENSNAVINADFKVLAALSNHYRTVNDILEKLTNLPEVIVEELPDIKTEKEDDSFINKLTREPKTFYIGALINQLWSGLNIPFHNSSPSDRSLGGTSDLSNKGSFDKLLLSEYANDDILFLMRLANNEALYIRREVPPVKNTTERVFLIDNTIKNWGTPKLLSLATAIAIANHPKSDYTYSAYIIGNSVHPIALNSVSSIIDALELLDSNLSVQTGLEAFFKNNEGIEKKEVFFLTDRSAAKNRNTAYTLNQFSSQIKFQVYTDTNGNIDIYKSAKASFKLVQHLQLPLKEIWAKKVKSAIPNEIKNEKQFPILFRNSLQYKQLLPLLDNTVFMVTNNKTLLQFFETTAKGWLLVFDGIDSVDCSFAIGRLRTGGYLLLAYSHHKKAITLYDIQNGEKKEMPFPFYQQLAMPFVFYDEKFYHITGRGGYSVSNDGFVVYVDNIDDGIKERGNKLKKIIDNRHFTAPAILKNLKRVGINKNKQLVFNGHVLTIRNNIFKIAQSKVDELIVIANSASETVYVFPDGSSVELNKSGIFVLRGANNDAPIYIPSTLDSSIGLACQDYFSGNEYYMLPQLFSVTIESKENSPIGCVKKLCSFYGYSLREAHNIVNNLPWVIASNVTKTTADKIIDEFKNLDVTTKINPMPTATKWVSNNISTPQKFYETFIVPFINNIIAYGN